MFRGGYGHHWDFMEKDDALQRHDAPIGLIVIVLQQYDNYHIKVQIPQRIRQIACGSRYPEGILSHPTNEKRPVQLQLDEP